MTGYEKIAIILSICAIVTSFLALGWNIYRDVILKPRLKVRLQISFILHGQYESPPKISISATNFGPRKIICSGIDLKATGLLRRIFRKVKFAQILSGYNEPYSSKIPCELDVGNTCTVYLPFVQDCFLAQNFTHLGIRDTFGRIHWAPKKDMAETKKKYKEEFG